ncbi:AraC family transcriptional regulator [Pedobacter gandavensis]|uniref:Helix-turn-helix domain-containing protein n=1 Tax=Pedobacter gandavensis TaxID=2679963 RepID=A0ABR6ERA6_9SPHI|nr:helix-turn-helix domain-containing protein [Pedobacter gandavensis]MBB2147767.1 helix-turn-helix domain-containing protein [Pedobacter gandavensis]
MIVTYQIEDFCSPCLIPGQFMMDRFENIGRPANMEWPHKHNFYEILWLERGPSKHTIDQHSFELSLDSIFFIAPGQIHELAQEGDLRGYSIMFTADFLAMGDTSQETLSQLSFMENTYQNPALALVPKELDALFASLNLLHTEAGRIDRSANVIRHLLLVFLFQIKRMVAELPVSGKDNLQVLTVKKFKKLVESHFKQETRLSFFAESLFMTPAHLNEVVKAITGKTAGETVRERLLLETKRMLMHGHLTVGQIASELGFADFSYFSRQFKKQEGVSPAAFRKMKAD